MTTAIIVSGALRFMRQASTTWKIPGDYFLVADKHTYVPQNSIPRGVVFTHDILDLLHRFRSVTFTENLVNQDEFYNTAIKMAWKWKCAYSTFSLFNERYKYDKVLIIRPDLYVHNIDGNYDLPQPTDYNIFSLGDTHIRSNGTPFVNDMFLCITPSVFKILSGLYDYLIIRYKSIFISNFPNSPDIHSLLFEYMLSNNITFVHTIENFHTTVIRETALDLFDEHGLKPGASYSDVSTAARVWWEKNIPPV
jgi:hypothetical protein